MTIFHPWESGRDDSPIWDDALTRVSITKLSKFEMLDVIAVDGAIDTIPSDEEYNKFIFLIDLMKMYDYDEKEMYEKFPFKIKYVSFSSMLYVAVLEQARQGLESLPQISVIYRLKFHSFPDGRNPFGFKDGLRNPHVEGSGTDPPPGYRQTVKAGEFPLI
ncbi:MAG: hypothetical protein WBL67_18010 [Nitrososphaeraceae archaeon]